MHYWLQNRRKWSHSNAGTDQHSMLSPEDLRCRGSKGSINVHHQRFSQSCLIRLSLRVFNLDHFKSSWSLGRSGFLLQILILHGRSIIHAFQNHHVIVGINSHSGKFRIFLITYLKRKLLEKIAKFRQIEIEQNWIQITNFINKKKIQPNLPWGGLYEMIVGFLRMYLKFLVILASSVLLLLWSCCSSISASRCLQ